MKNIFRKINEFVFLFVSLLLLVNLLMIFVAIVVGPSFNATIPFSSYGGFIVFPAIYFILSMFVDCWKNKKAEESQWAWLFFQFFFPVFGASIYYLYFRFIKKGKY
jgi:hypothetical protein